MTFAFATLAFLTAAWLAVIVLAGTIEKYGTKIRAALAGVTTPQATAMTVWLSPRYPARRAIRPQPRFALRAAA